MRAINNTLYDERISLKIDGHQVARELRTVEKLSGLSNEITRPIKNKHFFFFFFGLLPVKDCIDLNQLPLSTMLTRWNKLGVNSRMQLKTVRKMCKNLQI